MRWSQIKTLFIVSFLILNMYLITQLFDKVGQSDIGILEHEESTIEEQLENENIKIPNLDDDEIKEPFISVSQRIFTDDELSMFSQLENQMVTAVGKSFITSVFNDPVPVPKDGTAKEIKEIVSDKIIFSEDYVYWHWNKELNIILFFQKNSNRPVYYNRNGIILVYLNDKNEMTAYTQTMLGESESREENKSLIRPIKAIETLYDKHELHHGDEVTKIDIGLHTRVPLDNGVQVFVPTWRVKVNNEKDYFVNAIEGFAFSSNELEFLEETLILDIERIRSSMLDSNELKEHVLHLLEKKLAIIDRGGL